MKVEVELDEGLAKTFRAVCQRYGYNREQGLIMAVALFDLWARIPDNQHLVLQNREDGTIIEFPLQP